MQKPPASETIPSPPHKNHAKTAARPEATLLGLPAELRDEIYGFVLGPPPTAPIHPYDPLPLSISTTDAIALHALSVLVHSEVEALIRRKYTPTVFYFDDVPTLCKAKKLLKDAQCLPNAQFWLRGRTANWINSNYLLKRRIHQDTRAVISEQPGFQDCQLDLYKVLLLPTEGPLIERGIHTFDRIAPSKDWPHLHDGCLAGSPNKCRLYYHATYGPLAKSLRLHSYTWKTDQGNIVAGVVLQGKIKDVCLDGYAPCAEVRALLE